MKAITDKPQIDQEVDFVLQFGRDQMVFLARRGSEAQRAAARAVARRLPKMAGRIKRELAASLLPTPTPPTTDQAADLPPAA